MTVTLTKPKSKPAKIVPDIPCLEIEDNDLTDAQHASLPVDVEIETEIDEYNQPTGRTTTNVYCPLTDGVYCRQHLYHQTMSVTGQNASYLTEVTEAHPVWRYKERPVYARIQFETRKNSNKIRVPKFTTTRKAKITYDPYGWESQTDSINSYTSVTQTWSAFYDNITRSTISHSSADYVATAFQYWQGYGPEDGLSRDPKSVLQDILKSRMAPAVHSRSSALPPPENQAEVRARQTLRRIIGEKAYRKYVARSFVTVYGASGRVYQVFPGHKFTKVWFNGEYIEDLCVILTKQFAPTDSVIMRICFIEQSEEAFKEKANVMNRRGHANISRMSHAPYQSRLRHVPNIAANLDNAPITEIYKALKCKDAKDIIAGMQKSEERCVA